MFLDNISPRNKYNVRPTVSPFCSKQPKQLNLVSRFPRSTVQYDSSATGYVACEHIRFSSLFAAGDVSVPPRETSPAAKSEEKRMSSQATGYGELLVWFYSTRNGDLFGMNNNGYYMTVNSELNCSTA